MFRFRRPFAGLRVRALRRLYRTHLLENTAQARGLRLLRSWLSSEQQTQFDSEGLFEVVGSDSGKRYRIYYGTSVNVHEVEPDGRIGTGWCFVPMGGLVAGDVMLAQKIALETCERGALAVANKLPLLFASRRGPS
jgi:hypothetical protein